MVGLIIAVVFLSLTVLLLGVTLWARGLGPSADDSLPPSPATPTEDELDPGIIHRQRLETLGQVTGGIIHDFNNTLTTIMGYGELITQTAPEDSQPFRYADLIVRATSQAMKLTRQILTHARPSDSTLSPANVHQILDEAVALLSCILPGNVQIKKDFAAEKTVVSIDKTLFIQVLLNLAVNARDAMPQGGEIRIRTRLTGLPSNPSTEKSGAQGLEIQFEDTGEGVPAQAQGKIFQPFFTTKAQGTGLGLTIVRQVMESMKGSIHLDERSGPGALFRLTLPLSAKAASFETSYGEVFPGTGRVFIVDDDDRVLGALCEMVESLGYTTVSFSSPEQALEHYLEHYAEIDAALLDIDMPELTGIELFERMADMNPDATAYLITGNTASRGSHGELNPRLRGILFKPLRIAYLSQMLHLAIRN